MSVFVCMYEYVCVYVLANLDTLIYLYMPHTFATKTLTLRGLIGTREEIGY